MSAPQQSWPKKTSRGVWALWITAGVLLIVMGLLWQRQRGRLRDGLVVFCAHDLTYAEPILRAFEQRTGIPVEIVGDTEASKSLGLVERLLHDPGTRCDLFWNNQIAGTDRLQAADLLVSYRGSGWKRIPDRYKDPAGQWTGFAARLRVWIVYRPSLSLDQIAPYLQQPDWSQFAMSKPLYGTMLTQYSYYQETWPTGQLQEWHRQFLQRGGKLVAGNATVKDLVASGACQLGMTDTDDAFVAEEAGAPIAMRPITVGDLLPPRRAAESAVAADGVFVIPNTVAILRRTKQLPAAQQLVDFLVSAETEQQLARSSSRQIPLGPVKSEQLPSQVTALLPWIARGIDLRNLTAAQAACLWWGLSR